MIRHHIKKTSCTPVPSAQCPVPSERITRSPLLTQPLRSLLCITAFYTITLLPLQAEKSTLIHTSDIDFFVIFNSPDQETWKFKEEIGEIPTCIYYGPYSKELANKNAKGSVIATPSNTEITITSKNPVQFETGINFSEKQINFTYKKIKPEGEKEKSTKGSQSIKIKTSFGEYSSRKIEYPQSSEIANQVEEFINEFDPQIHLKEDGIDAEMTRQIERQIFSQANRTNSASDQNEVSSALTKAKNEARGASEKAINDLKNELKNDLSKKRAQLKEQLNEATSMFGPNTLVHVSGVYGPVNRNWFNIKATNQGFPLSASKSTTIGASATLNFSFKFTLSAIFASKEITIGINIPLSISNTVKSSINSIDPILKSEPTIAPEIVFFLERSLNISFDESFELNALIIYRNQRNSNGIIPLELISNTLQAGIIK